jgi:ribose transport system ATP-binding protein
VKSNRLLALKDICKSFPGVRVLKELDFTLERGEIHSLCGENGAGKSTLIKILAGVHNADSGTVLIDGTPQSIGHPRIAKQLGISTIYQENSLFQHLSIQENIFTGQEYRKHGFLSDGVAMQRKTEEMLAMFELDLSPSQLASSLGAAEQKIIEVIRALIMDAKILILDEPTASFGKEENRLLFSVIERVKQEDMGIIYISHHLDEVFAISDRITVLRDGVAISTYTADDVDEPQIIRDMVGRDASQYYSREPVPRGETVFEAEALSGNGVSDISFQLRKSELLGIAGLAGAGRTEMAELLFGAKPRRSGTIRIKGQRCRLRTPQEAIRKGLCMITEERKLTGLLLDQTITENIAIAGITKSGQHLVKPAALAETAEGYLEKFQIKASSVRQSLATLSGGNQQKVILAKWFDTEPDIFIFDEPTRGIDIGAREEIYHLMIDLLRQGKSIIMISSDLPELTALASRVLVMRRGRIQGELVDEAITDTAIMELAV